MMNLGKKAIGIFTIFIFIICQMPIHSQAVTDVTPTINAGGNFSIILNNLGSFYAFGDNTYSQLGDGTTEQKRTPVNVTDDNSFDKIKTISAGLNHVLAIIDDGSIYGWGQNTYGQVSNAPVDSFEYPEFIKYSTDIAPDSFKAVKAGSDFSMALSTNGKIYTWGSNTYGQLGNNKQTMANFIVNISDLLISPLKNETVVKIAAGNSFALALTASGKLYGWGKNEVGQLGNTSSQYYSIPTLISNSVFTGKTITDISAGGNFSVCMSSAGEVFTWGGNSKGQLGMNSIATPGVPKNISTVPSSSLLTKTIVAISAGKEYCLALDSDGRVHQWGGAPANAIPPKIVTELSKKKIKQISAGGLHAMAVSDYGEILTWGDNTYGQLGIETPFCEINIARDEMIKDYSTNLFISNTGYLLWEDYYDFENTNSYDYIPDTGGTFDFEADYTNSSTTVTKTLNMFLVVLAPTGVLSYTTDSQVAGPGEDVYFVNNIYIPSVEEYPNVTIKCFIWDSMSSMKPLCKMVKLSR